MDTIALTMREQQRVAVIERVFRGELTMAEAAWRPVDRPRGEQHGHPKVLTTKSFAILCR